MFVNLANYKRNKETKGTKIHNSRGTEETNTTQRAQQQKITNGGRFALRRPGESYAQVVHGSSSMGNGGDTRNTGIVRRWLLRTRRGNNNRIFFGLDQYNNSETKCGIAPK